MFCYPFFSLLATRSYSILQQIILMEFDICGQQKRNRYGQPKKKKSAKLLYPLIISKGNGAIQLLIMCSFKKKKKGLWIFNLQMYSDLVEYQIFCQILGGISNIKITFFKHEYFIFIYVNYTYLIIKSFIVHYKILPVFAYCIS